MPRTIGLIGAPSSAGAFAPGQEKAPAALRSAGLVEALSSTGAAVIDYGDVPKFRWTPDRANRYAQNAGAVLETIRNVANAVETAYRAGHFPLVIGGDCTIEIGTVLGAQAAGRTPGLFYFDPHADFNLPIAPGPGAFDWTGVAHLTGQLQTNEAISHAGSSFPILDPSDIYLYAQDPDQSRPSEKAALAEIGFATTHLEEVRQDPAGSAARAIASFAESHPDVLLHFDVDTIDFTDFPIAHQANRYNALPFDITMQALSALMDSPTISALTITEINPDLMDEEGRGLRIFVDRLVAAFV